MSSKVERQANESIEKYYNEHVYMCGQFYAYWNPMGFTPKYCLINLLCLVGMRRKNDCGIGEDGGEIMKREKAIILLERAEMCKELALTAR